MKSTLLFIVLCACWPGYASAMYKCTDQSGKVSYQQMPCAGVGATSVTIQPRVRSDATPPKTKYRQEASDGLDLTRDRMREAMRSKLAEGDLEGAMARATSEEDKQYIREEMAKRRKRSDEAARARAQECSLKLISVNRARRDAETHPTDEWWLNRANDETARYNAECGN